MDRIRIEGIRAYGRHGANPGECDHPQLFEIDVTLDIDLRAAQASDDLGETLDYAALHRRLAACVAQSSFALMERLAGALVEVVCADSRVAQTTLTLGKPGILDGATPRVILDRVNPKFQARVP